MPKKEKRRYILFWFFVGPAIILRVTTSVYPILKTFYFSVLDYDLLKRTKDYIGLENYLHLFNDVTIREITGFTLLFIISSVCLQLLLGMIVAHLLNANFKGKKLVRTINLIPWVIPVVVAGYAFRWMLDTDYGLVVDWIRRLIGLKPDLLENAVLAKLSLILVNVWKNTPFMALVLLAGFQSIPEELYESAMIDGANKFQRFLAITLPASSATVVTLGLF